MPRREPSHEEKERVQHTLEQLTDEHWKAFVRYAHFKLSAFKWMGIDEEPEDLVQNILLKALMSIRNCAVEVNLTAFICNCVKSEANQRIEAAFKNAEQRSAYRRYYRARCSGPADRGAEIARTIVEMLRVQLADDSDALNILESLLDGKPPRDACANYEMEPKRYNTVRNRIKRRARHAAAIARAGFGRGDFSRWPS